MCCAMHPCSRQPLSGFYHFLLASAAVFLVGQIQCINGHIMGAPVSVCNTLKPGHGEESLGGDVPYHISLDPWFVRGGAKITIKVASKNPSQYKLRGLLMVVKKKNQPRSAFGTFVPGSSSKDLKTIDCFDKKASGLTHISNNDKMEELRFQWIAPNTTSGEYELHATLVRDFNSYWVDQISKRTITVSANAPASSGLSNKAFTAVILFLFAIALSRTI